MIAKDENEALARLKEIRDSVRGLRGTRVQQVIELLVASEIPSGVVVTVPDLIDNQLRDIRTWTALLPDEVLQEWRHGLEVERKQHDDLDQDHR